MAFNRQPLYADGLLLVGDAGGMVNPFNGEGIAYAMEAARLGSSVVADAFGAAKNGGDVARERILATYPDVMKQALGGYFTLGRHFATMIGNPQIMKLAVTYGLPREDLMKIIVKVMANLADPGGKSATDRLYTVLTRLAPNA